MAKSHAGFHGAFWTGCAKPDVEMLDYFLVEAFIDLWVGSVVHYNARRRERR